MKNHLFLTVVALILSTVQISAQWSADPSVNTPVCTKPFDQYVPIMVSDGAGGAIITWSDDRGNDRDIYAQRLNAQGVAQWTENGVAICTATSQQSDVLITSDGSGGAIMAWYDYRNGNDDFYAQRINATGAVLWAANGVGICTAAGSQLGLRMTSDGLGGAILSWRDDRSGKTSIYAQRINGAGMVQWNADGVLISNSANIQWSPRIVSDGIGGAIIAYSESVVSD
jgi:hypothetical protein